MYLARSSPTVLTWFMDASVRGLQRPHSGTPRPPGASTPSGPTRFETAPARLLDEKEDAPAEYNDGLTVGKTFTLAIEEAAKLHPAAEPLIVYAALLAPEPIPLFLFSEARERFDEPLASMLAEDSLGEAVAALGLLR